MFVFYYLLNCIKYHNNKLKSSLLDDSSARLTNNFSTSLSQRLSSFKFLHMLANGPPSFGSNGLESSLSNFRRTTHLSKSSTIMALGCHFRVAGGDVLSGTGIRAAVEEAGPREFKSRSY